MGGGTSAMPEPSPDDAPMVPRPARSMSLRLVAPWFLLLRTDAVSSGLANGILRVFRRVSSERIGDGIGPMKSDDDRDDAGMRVVILGLLI